MSRILAALLSVTLAACAASPKAVHKTTNPPLTTEQVTENTPPGPAAKEPVELEGLTLKFNTLGFRVTLPGDDWNGRPIPQPDGSVLIGFVRPGSPGMVLLKPVTSDALDLKALAEAARQSIEASMPKSVFSPVSKEPNGRWSFTYEVVGEDGAALKGYFAVIEVDRGQKRFLLTTIIMPADIYDAGIVEAKSLLDSVAPL